VETENLASVEHLLEGLRDAAEGRGPPVEFDALFDDLVRVYVESTEPTRERIRESVRRSRWAALGFWAPGHPGFFRRFRDDRQLTDLKRSLMLESMLDARDDPRDTIAGVSDLAYWARSRDLDASAVLREVAQVSSAKSMLGMGSMQALLLRMADS